MDGQLIFNKAAKLIHRGKKIIFSTNSADIWNQSTSCTSHMDHRNKYKTCKRKQEKIPVTL